MNKQLLEYIRTLSQADRKSLTQKVLKTGEEFGELAKKALPLENAFATNHRFVEKRDVLEECADIILCALSVAYDLGFEDDDIEEMMQTKSEKWASLQAREAGVKYPLPFELHVTVHSAPADKFRSVCEQLGVKPIFLALQDRTGETVLEDVMTSSVTFGDNRKAVEELERIADGLADAGLNVVRKKIETVPWHPAAPSEKNGVAVMPQGGYFESHLNVIVEAADEEQAQEKRRVLADIARAGDAHLSRNVFKKLSDTAFTVMMTLRSYDGTREAFDIKRDWLAGALDVNDFKVEKVITEFSIFDTKTSHDASWLKAA